MLCPTCGKESSNLRVCGHCQTPYPTDAQAEAGARRSTRAFAAAGTSKAGAQGGPADDPRSATAGRSRLIRWSAIGLLAAITVASYFIGREPPIPAGVVVPNLIPAPMSPSEAAVTLSSVNATAQVQERDGGLFVRIGAATLPQRRAGLLALAQQYTRADEIVGGRKRAISFLDPDGNVFAKADPAKGVALTR